MDDISDRLGANIRRGSAAADAAEAVRDGRRHGLVEGGDVGAEDGPAEEARDGRFGPLGALGLGDQPFVEGIASAACCGIICHLGIIIGGIWGYSSGGR